MPPSEDTSPQFGNDNMDMHVIKTDINNNMAGKKSNNSLHGSHHTTAALNNGYSAESGLNNGTTPPDVDSVMNDFEMALEGGDTRSDNMYGGRSTRQSGGSNSSTIINVSNEHIDNDNQEKQHSIVDELNQTATSIRHVQLS